MAFSRALILLSTIVVCFGQDDNQSNSNQSNSTQSAVAETLYVVFFPTNENSVPIDNMCFTFFPLPDDNTTFLGYTSRVFVNGSYEIKSFIVTQVHKDQTFTFGSSDCAFTDIYFDALECGNAVYLGRRNGTYGECLAMGLVEGPSGVFGVSKQPQPANETCLALAAASLINNGLAEDEFVILPFNLPTNCVLN